ncbi:Programmed cell death protein 2 [Gracilariopsis chorda]|uniref:Programmed cell death protein 2 n=1 Tax=Gracilariopsis chorda TaxID=448386 RepID=A0A2V3J4S9_9FLOR|nr:Programmed cell death protein 2 [Gracilariopsis chorda]|eukprot:PXF49436.1 Programmed cell death protein 2 [Gracilariopsis chorda]
MASECVLGFCSSKWDRKNGEWYDTHIGGSSVWPDGLTVTIPPCPVCSLHRTFVLQAYAPHPNHSEREVYLFGCNSIKCSEKPTSWYALRVVKLLEENVRPQGEKNSQSASHKREQNSGPRQVINWESDSEDSDSEPEILAEELQLLSLVVEQAKQRRGASTHSQNEEAVSSTCSSFGRTGHGGQCINENANPLAAFCIEVDYEPARGQKSLEDEKVERLLGRYNEEEKLRSRNGIDEQWAAEQDDENKPETLALERFRDTISRAPDQILRYSFGGEPIWPSHPPPPINTKICACGSPMIFELQLLASCLHYLKPDECLPADQKDAGMNFASVATYTCAGDCTLAKVVAETAMLQVFEQEICVQQDDW